MTLSIEKQTYNWNSWSSNHKILKNLPVELRFVDKYTTFKCMKKWLKKSYNKNKQS